MVQKYQTWLQRYPWNVQLERNSIDTKWSKCIVGTVLSALDFENWLEPSKSQCANPQWCLQCLEFSQPNLDFTPYYHIYNCNIFFSIHFFGSATCPNIDCEWQPNWQSPHSVFTDISHRLSDFVPIHVWNYSNLFFSWFHKIKTGFLFRVRLFKNSRKTLPMWLYRKCVFIDVINGNIFNSLLGITIEIQMKEEYVVIVRYPNRYYAG